MKEYTGKDKYQFQHANIHEKDKKKDLNLNEQITSIGLNKIRGRFK